MRLWRRLRALWHGMLYGRARCDACGRPLEVPPAIVDRAGLITCRDCAERRS